MNSYSPSELDGSVLSDAQTRAQAVDPAKTIVASLDVEVALASFSFESCNDQGDPPFRGRSDVAMRPPAGTTPEALQQEVSSSLIAQGWSAGAGPGKVLFGASLHKGTMLALLGIDDARSSNYPGTVSLTIYGQCRNTGDHHNEIPSLFDITDELNSVRGH